MSSSSDVVLEATNLVKQFQTRVAVDNVSLQLRRGEIVALLGPNGAGKTTLVNMMLGRIPSDSGEITYHLDSKTRTTLEPRDFSCFPEDIGILSGLPLLRFLVHSGQKLGMGEAESEAAARKWLDRLNMSDAADQPYASLSRGRKQKINLVRSVFHSPALLFLDEPFTGLDPVNQELFVSLIRDIQNEGATIVLTDHQLSLVERLADRFIFLSDGKIAVDGTLEELRERVGTGTSIRLRLLNPTAKVDTSALEELPLVRSCRRAANGEIHIGLYAGASSMDILNYARRNMMISQIFSESPSLHDIYLEMFGREKSASELLEIPAVAA